MLAGAYNPMRAEYGNVGFVTVVEVEEVVAEDVVAETASVEVVQGVG